MTITDTTDKTNTNIINERGTNEKDVTTMASLLPSSFLSGAWYFVSYFISFVIRVVVTLAVYVLWTCCCFYLLLMGGGSLTPDGVVFQKGAAYYVVPVVAMLLLLGAIGFLALLRYFWRLPPELNMAAAVPEQDNYYSRLNVNSNTNSPTDDDARHADPTRTLLGVHYSEEVRIILQKIGRAALILLVWTIFLLLVLIFVNWVVEKIECKKRDLLICGSIPFWCFMASVMLCGAYFICGAVRRHWRYPLYE